MAVLQPRVRHRKAHPNMAADIMLILGMIAFVLLWGWIGYEVLRASLHGLGGFRLSSRSRPPS
jgi:hypothetical protein